MIIPILRAFRLSQKRKIRGVRKIGGARKTRGTRNTGERRRKRGEKITKMGKTG